MFYPIKLDKMRNLKYNMRAMSLIEDELGKPIAEIDIGNMTMKGIATVIWAGLAHEDKELTPDKVIDLIDEHSDMKYAITTMGEAFQKSFGDEESTENPRKAAGKAKVSA